MRQHFEPWLMISMPEKKDAGRVHPVPSLSKEKLLCNAVENAREALRDLTALENVGEHKGVVLEADRLVTHCFECLLSGYRGWYWTVTLARVPRSQKVTVDEMALRPGEDALLAPAWVPWADRLEPKDVSPTDRLPYRADDPRLIPGFEQTDEDADQLEDFEMGLGRKRTLSLQGRSDAFERWYHSDHGPNTAGTRHAKAQCSTCGFLMLMAGSARTMFGVCANEWSAYDGQVVSMDHGCGSHSETDVPAGKRMWDPSAPVVNEADLEVIE